MGRGDGSAEKACAAFIKNGCKPWSYGYDAYKWKHISNEIGHGAFFSRIGSDGYGFRIDERAVEYPWFLDKLPDGSGLMLDAGSALNHKCLVEHDKIRRKRLIIATLAPEQRAFWDKGISYIYEDIRETVFRDNCFDYIACISTIEHVGMDNTMLYTSDGAKREVDDAAWRRFLGVLRAKLKPGGRIFITMPFGKRKNHGWFQVFDAAMVDQLRDEFSPTEYSEDIFYYFRDKWNRTDRETAKDAACFDIHFQNEYEADFLAFSRSVVCLDLMKGMARDA